MVDKKTCNHEFKKIGTWDGRRIPKGAEKEFAVSDSDLIGGPKIKCSNCGEVRYATWDEVRKDGITFTRSEGSSS